MADGINYNHRHVASGTYISGTDHPITVKDLRDAIASFPDNAELAWGTCSCGSPLSFYRFKDRGQHSDGRRILQIELSGDDC